jgi:hypothetical protein
MSDEEKYLQGLIEGLVTEPKKAKIEKTMDERGILLTITPAKEDRGLLVGKGGDTINAVRNMMRVYARRKRAIISVKLDIPERSEKAPEVEEE